MYASISGNQLVVVSRKCPFSFSCTPRGDSSHLEDQGLEFITTISKYTLLSRNIVNCKDALATSAGYAGRWPLCLGLPVMQPEQESFATLFGPLLPSG